VPRLPLSPEVRELLSHPNPAIIATVRADGQPVSVATWYILDGDRILMNMDARRRRLAYLRHDPRVSLTVLDRDDWSTHVSLQGRVVEIAADEGLVAIDRIATHYTGKPFGNRDRDRVNAWMEVEHWNAWDLVSRPTTE
jgi:PPOX class probable F420-dependent enzyme